MVGPQVTLDKIPQLDTTNSSVDIDLIGIAKNNNDSELNVWCNQCFMYNETSFHHH